MKKHIYCAGKRTYWSHVLGAWSITFGGLSMAFAGLSPQTPLSLPLNDWSVLWNQLKGSTSRHRQTCVRATASAVSTLSSHSVLLCRAELLHARTQYALVHMSAPGLYIDDARENDLVISHTMFILHYSCILIKSGPFSFCSNTVSS